jgi:nucleotide-binding universal stress UspA family protein
MSYKDLLVHVDDSKSMPARLAASTALARTFDAHLTGLYVAPILQVPTFVQAQMPPEVIEIQQQHAVEAEAAAKAAFNKAVADAGWEDRAEWRTAHGNLADAVDLHARYADLTVLGQADPDIDAADALALPGDVALSCGRPILCIPYIGAKPEVGKRVLIAWNASRESTRAVNDAMPFLSQAETVEVLVVNPQDWTWLHPERHGEEPGADIALHLARHGVKVAAAHTVTRDIGVGDAVLSHAADQSFDLLVMGAYGRSRLREVVLGGATEHLMHHMTIPVLLSH